MTPKFVQHMDACLGCVSCMTACPSGVNYGKLIEETRSQIEHQYTRPLPRASACAGPFSTPSPMWALLRIGRVFLSAYQKLGLPSLNDAHAEVRQARRCFRSHARARSQARPRRSDAGMRPARIPARDQRRHRARPSRRRLRSRRPRRATLLRRAPDARRKRRSCALAHPPTVRHASRRPESTPSSPTPAVAART